MAGTAATKAEGGGGGWTETEKYSMLLQIINQITGDKPPAIKFNIINLPGRTPKAMTHVWGKIRAEAAAVAASSKGEVKQVTPRKRTPKDLEAAVDSESPPKKRKPTPRKKVLKEKVADEKLLEMHDNNDVSFKEEEYED